MSVSTSTRSKSLSQHVSDSLDTYFKNLNGHSPPDDLYDMIIRQIEPPLLTEVLKRCDGNQTRAAQMLGVNRATLRKKLRLYEISPV